MKNVQTLSNEALLCHLVDRETARKLARQSLAEAFGYARPRQGDLAEDPATYSMPAALAAAKELFTRCMTERLANEDALAIESPATAKALVCGRLAHQEREVFAALWLDTRHRVLAFQELSHGTIDSANVHTREVVKAALAINAAAVIFTHNHPSGNPEPSQADIHLTRRLKDALGLVDIRTLDHLIVAGNTATSMQEAGAM